VKGSVEMLTEKEIEEIKAQTDLCNTFCCYEDCEKCVQKYIDNKNKNIKR
jgi:queuine/archaeosine tRNA-ribosyltransferase